MKNYFKKTKTGFSLIEILVVLFIVSVGLLGVVSLIIQNIQVQSINRNKLIASSLAQEGIELIKQVRDDNWRAGRLPRTNLNPGSYAMDYRSTVPVTSASASNLYLKDGYYVVNSGGESGLTSTIFSRQISLETVAGFEGNPLQVKSIVSWTDHGRPYRYELQTLLFDWR